MALGDLYLVVHWYIPLIQDHATKSTVLYLCIVFVIFVVWSFCEWDISQQEEVFSMIHAFSLHPSLHTQTQLQLKTKDLLAHNWKWTHILNHSRIINVDRNTSTSLYWTRTRNVSGTRGIREVWCSTLSPFLLPLSPWVQHDRRVVKSIITSLLRLAQVCIKHLPVSF